MENFENNFEGNEYISSNSDNDIPVFADDENPDFAENPLKPDYTGYTVTPEGGYYNSEPQTPPANEPPPTQTPPAYDVYAPAPPVNAPTPPPPPPKKEKRGHSTGVVILSAVLAAVIGFMSCFAATTVMNSEPFARVKELFGFQSSASGNTDTDTDNGGSSNVNINIDENMESVAQAVAKKASNSVVGIRVSVAGMFGSSAGGEGSGVIYTKDGYIITNYHVIENGVKYNNSKIEVFIGDASSDSYTATVVGYNIASDLAVIKINAKNLRAIELGDSDKLEVGQYVVTIGSPGGLEFMGSVTYGIISGLNRQVSSDSDIGLIQTDAAINPGNSGGALLNSGGQLIGINSSKIVSEEFEGMGFAIPVNTAKQVCDKIISNKDKAEPYIGISINEKYTPEVLERYGYPAGAVVYSVANGSPADQAGIRRNDIITEFDGKTVTEYSKLPALVQECEPGEKVNVKVYRNSRTITLTVTVGSNTAG